MRCEREQDPDDQRRGEPEGDSAERRPRNEPELGAEDLLDERLRRADGAREHEPIVDNPVGDLPHRQPEHHDEHATGDPLPPCTTNCTGTNGPGRSARPREVLRPSPSVRDPDSPREILRGGARCGSPRGLDRGDEGSRVSTGIHEFPEHRQHRLGRDTDGRMLTHQ